MSEDTGPEINAASATPLRSADEIERERVYDEDIAPLLKQVAEKSAAAGMSFVSAVEWNPGRIGLTRISPTDQIGFAMRLIWTATSCQGNVDGLIAWLIQYARKLPKGSQQSVYLDLLLKMSEAAP